MSMGGDLNGVLVETMITHVNCWDDERSGGADPSQAFPFISRRLKVTNMFYSVVCRKSMTWTASEKAGGPGLSSISHVLLFFTSPPVTHVFDVPESHNFCHM